MLSRGNRNEMSDTCRRKRGQVMATFKKELSKTVYKIAEKSFDFSGYGGEKSSFLR